MIWGREDVTPPTTIAVAEGASEIGVPSIVIGGAPGVRVKDPTTYTEDGPNLSVSVPMMPTSL